MQQKKLAKSTTTNRIASLKEDMTVEKHQHKFVDNSKYRKETRQLVQMIQRQPKGGVQFVDNRSNTIAQLKLGDGLIVTEDADLMTKKTTNEKIKNKRKELVNNKIETVKKDQVGIELGQHSQKWTKMQVNASEKKGWILNEKIEYDPAFNMSDGAIKGKFEDMPEYVSDVKGNLFSDNKISSEDVQQGMLGDCWVLSVLGGMAEAIGGRTILKKMIKDNEDGTYTVRLFKPDKDGKPVEVDEVVNTKMGAFEAIDSKTDESKGIKIQYAQKTKTEAIWPLIVEKAVAQMQGGIPEINGGFATEAMFMFTGKKGSSYSKDGDDYEKEPAEKITPIPLIKMLKEKAGKTAITIGIPAKKEEHTFSFNKLNDTDYFSLLPHTGVKQDTIKIEYKNTSNEDVEKSKKDGVELIKYSEKETMIYFAPKDKTLLEEGKILPVKVTYQYTDLEGISGGHEYYLKEYIPGESEENAGHIVLGNPTLPDGYEKFL